MARRPFLLLDLSNNNTVTDLSAIKRAGFAGVWHKVSEGESFFDGDWKERSARLRAMGLRVGGYHFAQPGHGDVRREARFFAALLGKIQRRDLAPVLDFEVNPQHLPPAELLAWARAFNHAFRDLAGVWPLFYSFPSFISNLGATQVIGRGLWLASFGRNDGAEHSFVVPRPFEKALAHQFTSEGRVAGVSGRVDLSSAPRIVPLLAHGWRGL